MSLKKIALIVVGVLVLAGVVIGSILHSQGAVTKVATGHAVRQDLVSIVNGTGQIKPKTYVNVGATAFGRITHLYVKEGDHVKSGQLVATVESEQPASAVQAQNATIAASRTDVESYAAAERTAEANVAQAKADLEQKKFDYGRAHALYEEKLIAKQDYDAKKAALDVSEATLLQRQAAVAQAKAQTASARGHVDQAVATLRGSNYSLGLTQSRAPFDALVTNVPVREGETVVVSEDLKPGLSATAKITTAHRTDALTIPIQALVQRNPEMEKAMEQNNGKTPGASGVAASTAPPPGKSQMTTGVYVLRTDHKKLRAIFVPVKTGVTGATDIEILNGLQPGDEIVTGRYKILRSLKSGTIVKRDNTPETVTDKS
jgi:multidrug efflux pump subunit AcrA (membrane-fusion protein)